MTCLRCQQDNPSHAKFCLECGAHLKGTGEGGPSGAPHAELQRALTEALEQQTATAEILKVISRSAFDLQPVLETLLENAARLCAAEWGVIFRPDGEGYRMAAVYGAPPEFKEFLTRTPIPPGRGSGVGRAALERRPVQVVDVSADPEYRVTEFQRIGGFRTVLAVPMLREATLLGVFGLHRDRVRPFTEKQIQLVSTFADQAAIAIENVRLFAELQEKNLALTDAHAQVIEALEQQTATGQILGVIAASPTDVQPVFDTIARSTARLCEASNVMVFRVDGDILRLGAHHGPLPAGDVPLHRDTVSRRAVLDRQVIHLADAQAEVHEFPEGSALARGRGIRTSLSVPLMREGIAIGNIQAQRNEVRPFSDQQISLLKTFADQAVIAIENVRLFTELQEKNRALTEAHVRVTEALDQQTATSGILGVISSSPTDAQPVFDAIVRSASRLCGGEWAIVTRYDGELLHLAAQDNPRPGSADAASRLFPHVPHPARSITARALVSSAVVHVSDVETEDLEPSTRELYRRIRLRAIIAVPMIHEGRPIGVLSVSRETPGPFSDRQIDLLRTFADQAVIAIENVRLFKELQEKNQALTQAHAQVSEALEQQTATSQILRVISQSQRDIQPVFEAIVRNAVRLCGAVQGGVYRFDGELVHSVAHDGYTPEQLRQWQATWPKPVSAPSVACQAIRTQGPIRVRDFEAVSELHSPDTRANMRFRGSRSVLAVPMFRQNIVMGAISLAHRDIDAFSDAHVELLKTFADQAVIAIENARLFGEIEDKSRQLEAASQHKSEFLANMSHELRTPLNAIIGFSEVLNERMFGELNEKQEEYLKDIYASGQHLLSLINDILDLSKIEAGRMELEESDFDLPAAIDNALILVRERASRRGITLGQAIDDRVGMIRGDERKVKQVLLNLLSNALKFTPEDGRIDVRAAINDGMVEISVADTGVGIAQEDQEAIFEEFRQVGTADKKVEGTGLGLALSRKFIELHGGRIWVHSQPGKGSTFSFTLPTTR